MVKVFTISSVTRIRDFRRGDLLALWRIDQTCFEPGISYSVDELAWYMARPHAFTLVAEAGKGIVGFLVAHRGQRGSGHIITIDVVAAARRGGLGSRLLAEAEARLAGAGCAAVTLETAVSNLAAIAFYKRHGYSVIRTIPRYYQNSLDALLMRKEIGASAEPPISSPAPRPSRR